LLLRHDGNGNATVYGSLYISAAAAAPADAEKGGEA